MKKTLFQFVALILLVASMTSCEKTGKDYQQVIPANATGVIAIKAKQIAEKADMNEGTKAQIINVLKGGLKASNTEKLEEVLKNPEASGISMSDPLLVFGIAESKQFGLAAKVKSQTKLNDLFSLLQSEGIASTPEKKGDYSEVIINNIVFTYDEHSLLLLVANNNLAEAQQAAAIYMAQGKEQSIVSNEMFRKTISGDTDLKSFMSVGASQTLLKNLNTSKMPVTYTNLPDSVTCSKMYIITSLNFEKGNIQFKVDYDSNDKDALKKYKEYCDMLHKQGDIFLNRFPASTLLYTGCNTDWEKVYKYLEPNLKNLPFDQASMDIEKLFNSIGGNISLGVTNVSPIGFPSILFYADVKDNYPLTFIQEQLAKNKVPLVPNGENAWKINIPMMNLNMYLGIKNNQFYFTNDENKYAQIDQPATDPLGNSPQGRNLKESYSCFYLNISQIMQIPMLNTVFMQMGAQGNVVKNALNGCDYLETTMPTPTNQITNFYLKDKNQNSLKVITTGAEQLLPLISVRY